MATTKFTGTFTSLKTVYADPDAAITLSVSRTSGNAIPANAVISSVTLKASKLYQYSSWRSFRVRKTGLTGSLMSGNLQSTGNARDENGNLITTSNTWNLYTTTALYTGLTKIAFVSSVQTDGDAAIAFVSGCVVTITVTYTVPPTLDENYPRDAKMLPGSEHTLATVIATAGDPATYTYQWYKDGEAVPEATGETLTVTMGTTVATYYCVVTHTLGTFQTRTATLDIAGAACLRIGDEYKAVTPYIFHTDQWNPVVPHMFVDGAFKPTAAP